LRILKFSPLRDRLHIALVGNPNSGKTSLFNSVTGLNQKVGNFPGVTVDKKTGRLELNENLDADIIDLPGTYSLYPKRGDEWVAYRYLMQQDGSKKPDLLIVVVDASNLRRNLLFCSQIIDLKIPVVITLTMMDIARKKGTQVDIAGLQRELGVPIVSVNPRRNKCVNSIRKLILSLYESGSFAQPREFIDTYMLAPEAVHAVKQVQPLLSNYTAIHYLINHEHFQLPPEMQIRIEGIEKQFAFNPTRTQAEEIMQRYTRIKQIMQSSVVEADPLEKSLFTEKLDDILLHRKWGYVILLLVLFLLFQSIFTLAQFPMDGIEWSFSNLSNWLGNLLPSNWFSDLIINGVVAGLSGIMVFVPQIMILFGLITLLEDTGYMARISFLTDKLMRNVGLNGKSVMPMISGLACAVPAVMSARNIENKKERLLTILVTPLMSCSARLPVYTILIALVIPRTYLFGFIGVQGLVMMGLYFMGTAMALLASWVFKWFIKSAERSYFILELPVYRGPRWKNIFYTMVQKAKIFVFDAGKIILVISIILWALSSYGPPARMEAVRADYERLSKNKAVDQQELEKANRAAELENSYAGILGKSIEPAIRPLGYDWKIGIALITSFAAREVFVGTMATLYSVGEDADDNATLRQKMQAAVKEDGTKVYTLGTGLSLMIFYVLAMQCMSTLAVVKRETRSWKWPVIQLLYMTGLAYIFSLLTYQLFK
jgi:ferrous iron transport protein B